MVYIRKRKAPAQSGSWKVRSVVFQRSLYALKRIAHRLEAVRHGLETGGQVIAAIANGCQNGGEAVGYAA